MMRLLEEEEEAREEEKDVSCSSPNQEFHLYHRKSLMRDRSNRRRNECLFAT